MVWRAPGNLHEIEVSERGVVEGDAAAGTLPRVEQLPLAADQLRALD